jgi:hypothetical protein
MEEALKRGRAYEEAGRRPPPDPFALGLFSTPDEVVEFAKVVGPATIPLVLVPTVVSHADREEVIRALGWQGAAW